MHDRITVLAAAALACGCAHPSANEGAHVALGPPYAAEAAPAPRITRYADQNRDGKVTREEARVDPALAKTFDRYDLDHNRVLDRGEFARLENAGRVGMGAGVAEGFTIQEPAGTPYDQAAEGWSKGPSPSLNRTGVDQIRAE